MKFFQNLDAYKMCLFNDIKIAVPPSSFTAEVSFLGDFQLRQKRDQILIKMLKGFFNEENLRLIQSKPGLLASGKIVELRTFLLENKIINHDRTQYNRVKEAFLELIDGIQNNKELVSEILCYIKYQKDGLEATFPLHPFFQNPNGNQQWARFLKKFSFILIFFPYCSGFNDICNQHQDLQPFTKKQNVEEIINQLLSLFVEQIILKNNDLLETIKFHAGVDVPGIISVPAVQEINFDKGELKEAIIKLACFFLEKASSSHLLRRLPLQADEQICLGFKIYLDFYLTTAKIRNRASSSSGLKFPAVQIEDGQFKWRTLESHDPIIPLLGLQTNDCTHVLDTSNTAGIHYCLYGATNFKGGFYVIEKLKSVVGTQIVAQTFAYINRSGHLVFNTFVFKKYEIDANYLNEYIRRAAREISEKYNLQVNVGFREPNDGGEGYDYTILVQSLKRAPLIKEESFLPHSDFFSAYRQFNEEQSRTVKRYFGQMESNRIDSSKQIVFIENKNGLMLLEKEEEAQSEKIVINDVFLPNKESTPPAIEHLLIEADSSQNRSLDSESAVKALELKRDIEAPNTNFFRNARKVPMYPNETSLEVRQEQYQGRYLAKN